jgi:hypothetical protein
MSRMTNSLSNHFYSQYLNSWQSIIQVMLAARMHEYNKPILLEQVQEAKNLSGERVLVKVGGAEFVVLIYK